MPRAPASKASGGAARAAPPADDLAPTCPHYHRAVELLGQRWTGAIVEVLLRTGEPVRFTDIAGAIPDISDRLLSRRLKDLQERGIVARADAAGPRYALTDQGRELEPAVAALKAWGRRWLDTSASSFRPA
jgi:DNA-binding HxlR family transcriptional regulator